jgi:CheY-like chemotaxis protein
MTVQRLKQIFLHRDFNSVFTSNLFKPYRKNVSQLNVSTSMTILFIDDDHDDTDLYCEAIAYLNSSEFIDGNKEPVDCIVANNGCQALEIVDSMDTVPDYIFLDINMPVMGGRECLSHLKANPKYSNIPIIMLSTSFRDDDAKEFKMLGASDCILKPRGFNDLVKIFAKYIYAKY